MRLISQDGTFDVPYDQVVIQRYSDGIYWLNKNLIGVESGISEDFKIASYSSEEKAIKVMEKLRENYKNFTLYKEDFLYFRFPEDEEVQE
jgi:hypothetical protein|nr:MAG TPA: hypothetical protein [Caudoviricetes sp.]